MPMVPASWQLSAGIAVGLAIAYLILTIINRPRLAALKSFCLQFGVVVAIFSVYQHTSHHSFSLIEGAQQRALWIAALEQRLFLPSELTIQQWVLPHPLVVQGLNTYYAGLHLTSMTLFLIWLWWRHKPYYVLACVTVAGTTLVCVTIQNISVAPPRLVPELGYVDTALQYGQSVYPPTGAGIAGQLAAMPSIHVAWAGILAAFAVAVSTSRWRWLLVAHFVATFVVVVATANHWWLDGVVGLLIAWMVYLIASWLSPPPAWGEGLNRHTRWAT